MRLNHRSKRLLLLTLALAMLLLAACGARQETAPAPAEETAAPAEQAESVEAEAPAETPEPTPTQAPKKELPPPPDIDITSWEYLYAGPTRGVGVFYHPEVINLENQYMDIRCQPATKDFLNAAREAGYKVWIGVAYRNNLYTKFWYDKEIEKWGSSYEAAQHGFAPGCSEHHTGLAFDITDEQIYAADYNNRHDETVADTEVYKWMAEHCTDYGFIVRYPEGKEEFYHMACYPGHFRYVGVEAAKYITENDLCFEEFLALYGVNIK
ncbi:MAG: M15 family metallopeptidase [Oscillospiraceae bacterium]|nr:M15 family metallopeptidase [Oscillospiraceae bacterium]